MNHPKKRRFLGVISLIEIAKHLAVSAVGMVVLLLCIGIVVTNTELTYSLRYPEGAVFNKRLSEARKLSKKSVYLQDLTTFKWDYVCFLWHYDEIQEIQEHIGNSYIIYPLSNVMHLKYHLVFAKSDKGTVPVVISRKFYVLNDDDKPSPSCITFEKAKTKPFLLPDPYE